MKINNRKLVACSVFTGALTGLFLFFQNCSETKFATDNSSKATASGGPEIPLVHSGDDATGTLFQPGNGDATGILVSPPQSFASSTCTLAYPFASASPATSVVFNESEVLVAFSPGAGSALATPGLTVSAWYSDEHAMVLGVRRVIVKSAGGSVATDYPVSALSGNPGMILNPSVGAMSLTGNQAGTDASNCAGVPFVCARPLYPSLFITDITGNPAQVSGDWQYGGQPIIPHAIFGTWKAAVRTVDLTTGTDSLAPDSNPARNNTNLGGIPFPAGASNAGFSTVVSWEVSRLGLQSGHSYRLQFMVHDGDQTRAGGDTGQNCVNIQVP